MKRVEMKKISKSKENVSGKSDIGLLIEDYRYIFSDFDSRPYSHRLLSEDLLSEMSRTIKDKKAGEIKFNFVIPNKMRDVSQEVVIKKHLKGHFEKGFINIRKEYRRMLRQGSLFILFGIFFMIVATFFLTRESGNSLIIFLAVLSEPAGWFLFWEGLSLVVFDVKKKLPDMNFYSKMSKARFTFLGS
jgi:hypothetical protein